MVNTLANQTNHEGISEKTANELNFPEPRRNLLSEAGNDAR